MLSQSPTVAGLIAALAAAQGAFTVPKMSGKAKVQYRDLNNQAKEYEFKYAPMSEGLEAVRAALSSNGIALTQRPFYEDRANGHRFMMVETRLSAGEEWLAMTYPAADIDGLMTDGDGKYRFDPKKLGAAVTYAKRYSLFSFLSIAGEEDIEGDSLDLSPTQAGRRAPAAAPALAKLEGPDAEQQEKILLADIEKLSVSDEFATWARDVRTIKARLPSEAQRRIDSAFAARQELVRENSGGQF